MEKIQLYVHPGKDREAHAFISLLNQKLNGKRGATQHYIKEWLGMTYLLAKEENIFDPIRFYSVMTGYVSFAKRNANSEAPPNNKIETYDSQKLEALKQAYADFINAAEGYMNVENSQKQSSLSTKSREELEEIIFQQKETINKLIGDK